MGRRKPEPELAKIGHNSNLTTDEQKKLKGFVEEIEHIEAAIKTLSSDKTEIYTSARESGFDTAAIRHIVKVRKMDRADRDAWQNAVDSYEHALGMLVDTPLGQAAIAAAENLDIPEELRRV